MGPDRLYVGKTSFFAIKTFHYDAILLHHLSVTSACWGNFANVRLGRIKWVRLKISAVSPRVVGCYGDRYGTCDNGLYLIEFFSDSPDHGSAD